MSQNVTCPEGRKTSVLVLDCTEINFVDRGKDLDAEGSVDVVGQFPHTLDLTVISFDGVALGIGGIGWICGEQAGVYGITPRVGPCMGGWDDGVVDMRW